MIAHQCFPKKDIYQKGEMWNKNGLVIAKRALGNGAGGHWGSVMYV